MKATGSPASRFSGGAICRSSDRVEVHHRTYHNLHDEQLTDCVPLCYDCHQAEKRRLARRRDAQEVERMREQYNADQNGEA